MPKNKMFGHELTLNSTRISAGFIPFANKLSGLMY